MSVWLVPILVSLAVAVTFVALVLLGQAANQWRRHRAIVGRLRPPEDLPAERRTNLLRPGEEGEEEAAALERAFRRILRIERAELLLEQAAVGWSASRYLLFLALSAAVGGLLGLAVTRSPGMALLAALIAGTFPYLYLLRCKRKRLDAFESTFPEAIDLLGRSLRAGHAFSTGLQMVAEEMPDPVGMEFRRVFDEQRFGIPIEDALQDMCERIEIVDVQIFVTAVLVQRQVGGNLAEILDNLSGTIRDRFTIRRQVRVHTAQGRFTGYLLSALPIAIGLLLSALNPEYMKILFEHPVGRLMISMAVILQIAGYFVIRRIVDIEV